MFRTRKLKQTQIVSEDDYETYEHKRMVHFQPHCYVSQLALAEAKQFDDTVALANRPPVYGEDE